VRTWKVGGLSPKPRFQHEDGREWWGGDTITEEDLQGIYRGDQIEALLEIGALLPFVEEPLAEGEEPTGDSAIGDYPEALDGESDPEASGPEETEVPTGEGTSESKPAAKAKAAAAQ
jgi:hypothetical protein